MLKLLKVPYGKRAPQGKTFEFSWGKVAVLQEHLVNNRNIIVKNNYLVAWVGDLVIEHLERFVEVFANRLREIQKAKQYSENLENDKLFSQLNGAFAFLLADAKRFCIITDPMSFTPVYVGKDKEDNAVSFGTHPDLVASISNSNFITDLISAGEFLNWGCCTFPYTMHANVREMKPGRIHIAEFDENTKMTTADHLYWKPPKEFRENAEKGSLVRQLRNALLSAVRKRCNVAKIGVLLSGGLDSRLVLAAIPTKVECICLTYANNPNRETSTASQVAKCYGRTWVPLYRDAEFLANNIVDTVFLMGCEFDWFDAHNRGFAAEIEKQNVECLLTGFLFDMYLKGLYAKDWIRVKRLFGALPPVYHKVQSYHFDGLADFWSRVIFSDIIEKVTTRKEEFYASNLDCNRSSLAEWVTLYPFSQDPMAYWVADRRILPIRMIAADRQLLDFAFRYPLKLKLERTIFERVTKEICAKSLSIPRANDGVRLGSSHWSRLVQRAVRKLQDGTIRVSEKLGREQKIQHSWHNYPKYWRESEKLRQLIREYGSNLEQFDGILFKESSRNLLERKDDIEWQYGFRLLQLSVWLGIIKEYRDVLKGRSR